jgi:hypothetical protein
MFFPEVSGHVQAVGGISSTINEARRLQKKPYLDAPPKAARLRQVATSCDRPGKPGLSWVGSVCGVLEEAGYPSGVQMENTG